jgi:hypothetical protein
VSPLCVNKIVCSSVAAPSVSLVTVPRISDSSPIIAVSCAVAAVVFSLAIDPLLQLDLTSVDQYRLP